MSHPFFSLLSLKNANDEEANANDIIAEGGDETDSAEKNENMNNIKEDIVNNTKEEVVTANSTATITPPDKDTASQTVTSTKRPNRMAIVKLTGGGGAPAGRGCKVEGCTKYRKAKCEGYCLTCFRDLRMAFRIIMWG